VCAVNFGSTHVPLPLGEVLLTSVPEVGEALPGAAAVSLRPR
jgi:hypothetical protein